MVASEGARGYLSSFAQPRRLLSGIVAGLIAEPAANLTLRFGHVAAAPENRAVGVEQHQGRIRSDLKLSLDRAAAVLVGQENAVVESVDAGLRLSHAAGALARPDLFTGDADDFEPSVAILRVQAGDFGKRPHAGRAPRPPEIEQHQLTVVLREVP